MVTSQISLKGASRIDFTGQLPDFTHYPAFSSDVISLIRKGVGSRVLVVIDVGWGFGKAVPHKVRDHMNLTGSNPLVGPNDSCGERFPSVNSVYLSDFLPELPAGVLAGLKPGVVPSADDLSLMRSLGADFYSYNLVPTMIVAAHAGFKVLGVVIPEGTDKAAIANLWTALTDIVED